MIPNFVRIRANFVAQIIFDTRYWTLLNVKKSLTLAQLYKQNVGADGTFNLVCQWWGVAVGKHLSFQFYIVCPLKWWRMDKTNVCFRASGDRKILDPKKNKHKK